MQTLVSKDSTKIVSISKQHSSSVLNKFTMRIGDKLKQKLFANLNYINDSPYAETESFLRDAHDVFRRLLPSKLYDKIRSLTRDIDSKGYLLIENLPVDNNLCPTPNLTNSFNKNTFISEACISGICQLIGDVFGYKNEKEGKLFHNIIPKQGKSKALSNEGFGVLLDLHNEDIHLYPHSPTFVSLFCLRKDRNEDAKTLLLPIKPLLASIPSDILTILRQPLFFVDPPESFGKDNKKSTALPVIDGPLDNPQVIVEFNDMQGLNSKAKKALYAFKQICYNSPHMIEVKLKPGDLLVFDNRKVIHGRTSFRPYFDGNDRWCHRMFIKTGGFWDWRGLFKKNRILNF